MFRIGDCNRVSYNGHETAVQLALSGEPAAVKFVSLHCIRASNVKRAMNPRFEIGATGRGRSGCGIWALAALPENGRQREMNPRAEA
jgi:hypothetical protein